VYVELHAASAFSFLEGASTPEALVDRAAALGYPALALVDRDGVYGAPRLYAAARAAGIKAIVGAELTMAGPEGRRWATWRLPVLVASRAGYRQLCRLVTQMKLGAPKGQGTLTLEALEGHTTGLIALVGRAALAGERFGVGGLVDRLVGLFGREQVYIEWQRHLTRDEEADNQALAELASAFRLPIVATNDVRYATPDARLVFDVFTCLRHKTTLAEAGRRLSVNAERCLKPPDEMARLFADRPDAVAATRELADRLEFTLGDLGYRFPEYPVPPGETQASFLRKIVEVGARERYRPYHARAQEQIARELALIEKLDLAGYFLTVWDIVNFCRQQGILVQGRGSAANSAVCYSLGITAVDPVGMDLLFERFLSEERGEWPDIDLDLPSGERRERVLQYVYRRYGPYGAGMTATVITYRERSAAREVGKVLGLDPQRLDRLATLMPRFEVEAEAPERAGEGFERALREAGFDLEDAAVRRFADLWRRLQDLPRHLGQHSGGLVICQGRLDEVVPLENAAMPGRVVIQWDKEDCADLGIVKVDLLGLGMMAVLQDALELINGVVAPAPDPPLPPARACDERETNVAAELQPGPEETNVAAELQPSRPGSASPRARASGAEWATGPHEMSVAAELQPGRPGPPPPRAIDLAHLPPDDPEVYRLLQEADTVGVFQVESRAQMATLPRLTPRCFYDLVVEVAIIRPGPIVGQMVHPYLRRRQGLEPVTYPHPSLEPILARTLGVPLFQEQLLRMAMVAAGFTGGEAEELRRAFGFKRSVARMRAIEAKLYAGMAQRGIAGEAAESIVRSISSFALYGFPESHAASFALLVYASAYLKVHYPAAFYTALLNNQPMGFYHPATIVKDAQRRGVRFRPIDVQRSRWACTVEPDGAVRLGLRYVAGLREEVGRRIEAAASAAGPAGGEVERCPKCGCDDRSMLERIEGPGGVSRGFCNVCAHDWTVAPEGAGRPRFASIEDFVARTGVHRGELATLAAVGALAGFGYERREALWQIEQACRPAGALFAELGGGESGESGGAAARGSPLRPMTAVERVVADYEGTGLTLGPHPMAFRRAELALRGVWRAADLRRGRHGRRVRVAGAVITRQRPGTAKGFVFLTLEDETGLANVIVRPDLFEAARVTILSAPYLVVEGVLQVQDGVTAVKAERVHPLAHAVPAPESHDFS
jgi:error-prone DNA polymerase